MVKRSDWRFPSLVVLLAIALLASVGCSSAPAAPTVAPTVPPAAAPTAPSAAAPTAVPAAAATAAPAVKGGLTPEEKDAALKEQEVNYYTAATTAQANQVKAQAEKALGIKVNVIRLSSGLAYNRVLKEYEENVNNADIIETSVIDHFLDMKQKKMLQVFTPSSIGMYRDPAYFDPEHYWHTSRIGMGSLNYNVNLLKGDMIPKTWKDLTDPKYNDKLVQGHVKASGTSAILAFNLVKLYGWEYFEALKKNNIMTQQSCDQANILAQGERLVGLCDHQITAAAAAQGMPLGTVLPEDGVFGQVGPAALLAKAPHPNAGKLFLEWLLSPAGQSVHAEGGIFSALDSPDIKYPTQYPDPRKVKVLIPDPIEVGEWLKGARDKFSDMFGG